jgi:hypothetical protein
MPTLLKALDSSCANNRLEANVTWRNNVRLEPPLISTTVGTPSEQRIVLTFDLDFGEIVRAKCFRLQNE